MKINLMKRAGCICLSLFYMLIAMTAVAAPNDDSSRKVRVGYYRVTGFQDYDAITGSYSGYGYEYLLAIAQHTGWQYEFVPVDFAIGLEMLKKGELDLMNNVSYNPERAADLLFSDFPSGSHCVCIKMRNDDMRVAYEDFAAFNNLTIGVRSNSYYKDVFLKYCQDHGCMPKIRYFDDYNEYYNAFYSGQIDAILVTSTFSLGGHVIGRFSPESFYFAVPHNQTELMRELNQALNFIKTNDPYFEMRLMNKYYGAVAEKRLVMSVAEQEYLNRHGSIRVGYIKDEYPLSYIDEKGEFAGATAEVFRLLAEHTGLNFEYVPIGRYETVADKSIDVIASVPTDYIWAEKYGFKLSQSFADINIVKVYSNNEGNGVMALPKDKYISDLCRRTYGQHYIYKEFSDTKACLEAVKNGSADVTCINSYEYELYLNQAQYRHLNFQVTPEIKYSMSIGVFDNVDYNVYTLVMRGLTTLSRGELSSIFMNETMKIKRFDLGAIVYGNPRIVVVVVLFLGIVIGMLAFCYIYFRMLHNKNMQLARTARMAAEANWAKSEFLSRMSHDLRTPMHGVLGTAELAKEETGNPAAIKEYLAQIDSAGRFMLGLINDILDMSKIENGQLNLKQEPLSTADFKRDINSVIKPLMYEKQIDFVLRIDDDPQYIITDRLRYNQLFFNLLSNAAKFTPPGGRVEFISEIIGDKDGKIGIRKYVRDSGIGMTENFIKHMYEPFSQESRTDLNEQQGTGLGLAIVKSIVEAMGGSINVNSEPGYGTEFQVELWLDKYDQIQLQEPSADDINLADKRILLVDDHPLNLKIAEKLLVRRSAIVDKAENGLIAVEKFTASPVGYYDAILIDIRMPVLNGLEATKRIRNLVRADAATVPIIAMTANLFAEDIEQTRQAGMNEHLAKPIEPQKLYAALDELINKRGK